MRKSTLFILLGSASIGLISSANDIHAGKPGFWLFLIPMALYQMAVFFAEKE